MNKFSILLFIVFMVMGTMGYSQYNRTFTALDASSNYLKQTTIDIVDAGNGNTCVLSKNYLAASCLTLKELDMNGNVNFHTSFYTNSGEYISPTKLLRAANGDYIVVGFYSGPPNNGYNPFAARFTNTGGWVWFYEYPSNISAPPIPSYYTKVNVVLAADDPNESYILVAPGDNSSTTLIDPACNTINAIKFDAMGMPVWNKKYGYAVAGNNRQTAPIALAYGSGRDNSGKYFIAGANVDAFLTEQTFHMAIDGNGNMFSSGYELYSGEPGYPFGHSAIYDASTDEFILARTFGNSLVIPNAISEIAITKIDYSLNIIQTDMYWEDDPSANLTENYSYDIKEDATGMNYILGCFVAKSAPSYMWITSAILKVDKLTNPIVFNRYNTATRSYPAAIASTVDGTLTERYVLGITTNSVPNNDVRVLSTDIAGVTCGWSAMVCSRAPVALTEIWQPWNEEYIGIQPILRVMYPRDFVIPTDCDSMNPQYKTTSVATTITSGNFNIYPSILSDGDRLINFDITTIHQTDLSVVMYSIEGKEIARKYISLPKGQNRFSWEAVPDLPGNYIISIKSADGLLSKTARITKL